MNIASNILDAVMSEIQLLAYADDVNILGGNTDSIQKNTEALLDAGKEVGLEVNSEKTKYMFMSRKKAGHITA
jgi:hypothetical protein